MSRIRKTVTLPAFPFHIFFFHPCHKVVCNSFFALFPQTFPSILHLFLLYLLFLPLLPLLFLLLFMNSPHFDWVSKGPRVRSLAVCFKGTRVTTLAIIFQGPQVLTLAVFLIPLPLTSLPRVHPHPLDVDLESLTNLSLIFLLLHIRQVHPKHEEDQAPNYSLECLHWSRLALGSTNCWLILPCSCSSWLLLLPSSLPGIYPWAAPISHRSLWNKISTPFVTYAMNVCNISSKQQSPVCETLLPLLSSPACRAL